MMKRKKYCKDKTENHRRWPEKRTMKKYMIILVALVNIILTSCGTLDVSGLTGAGRLAPYSACYITEVRANGEVIIELAPGVKKIIYASWFPGTGSVPSGCTVAEACNRTMGQQVRERARRAGIEIDGTENAPISHYVLGVGSVIGNNRSAAKATRSTRSTVRSISTTSKVNSGSSIKVNKEMHIADTGKVTISDYDF